MPLDTSFRFAPLDWEVIPEFAKILGRPMDTPEQRRAVRMEYAYAREQGYIQPRSRHCPDLRVVFADPDPPPGGSRWPCEPITNARCAAAYNDRAIGLGITLPAVEGDPPLSFEALAELSRTNDAEYREGLAREDAHRKRVIAESRNLPPSPPEPDEPRSPPRNEKRTKRSKGGNAKSCRTRFDLD